LSAFSPFDAHLAGLGACSGQAVQESRQTRIH
jgi:uncharacterized OsmC-like protein